ncbi:MAG: DUF2087 domain-containing protein [Candidatus Bipolaricaulota bacterium]|nr:MAG: DUF2087 domain-containing protein [Candidatus Bipolaricaulota bacterium]
MERALEAWEEKVLQTFLDGDRLRRLPAKRKKRMVVLEWLAERFEPARSYTESEVNAILSRHHPDVATIRRELVWNEFMDRERSIYRRHPPSEAR